MKLHYFYSAKNEEYLVASKNWPIDNISFFWYDTLIVSASGHRVEAGTEYKRLVDIPFHYRTLRDPPPFLVELAEKWETMGQREEVKT